MKHIEEAVPIIFTTSMATLTALFGGWDTAFQVFVVCMVADILTGVTKAFVNKDFSSKRMRKGFATKFGYIIVIVLATHFDKLMPEDYPILRAIAVWFYIAVEGSSVLENLAQMGVPIPNAVIERLDVVKHKSGNKAELDENGKFKHVEKSEINYEFEDADDFR